MKFRLLVLTLVALLCACANGVEYDPISNIASDAAPPPPQSDAGKAVTPVSDAAITTDSAFPTYVPCVTEVSKATAYPRLTEKVCTDSLDNTYSDGYLDIQLNLKCRWGLTCELKTRCLPENDQSSPEYADDTCTKPIAMVVFKNGEPLDKYVGLDQFAVNTDAGTDAGWYSCRNIYTIASPWRDNGTMFYRSLDDGAWTCNPTYINFLGLKMYYLSSSPIDPSIFVEQ